MEKKQEIKAPVRNNDIFEALPGDKIFNTEFVFDGTTGKWDTKEYEIEALHKNNIEDADEGAFMVTMHDVKYPNVKIKHDISKGFFFTEAKAIAEMIKTYEFILAKMKEAL